MKNSLFLLLAGAAVLSLASCSQDKTATTTAADGSAMTTTTTTTTTGPESDAAIEARAQRIADKMVADMKITDEATKTKIRTVYVNRAKRMGEMRTKYTTDTTGMAAATRQANAETDTEFKTIFTDPTQYQSYESSRTTYDDSNYMDDAASSTSGSMDNSNMSTGTTTAGTDNGAMSNSAGTSTTDNAAMSSTTTNASMSNGTDMATRSKTKMADGSKTKTKMDGTVKAKDADGSKMKIK